MKMYNEKMDGCELWIRGEEELLEALRQHPDAVWLCVGFGDPEDVDKIPIDFYEDAPDLLAIRMN